MEVIKKIEIDFSSLYQEGHSKIYSAEKVCSLRMGEGIPLKKDRNRWERGALLRKKLVKSFFLIVYFHLRFSIYDRTHGTIM